jgi:AraC-like DNA-binding protein
MRLVLNIGKRLADTVAQMAESRNLSVECFLSQLVDAVAADFRLQRYEPAPPILPAAHDAADQTLSSDLRKQQQQLSPEVVQKMLHLSQSLSVNELARRFNCSPTTVARYVRNYLANGHRHSLVAGRHLGKPASSKALSLTGLAK